MSRTLRDATSTWRIPRPRLPRFVFTRDPIANLDARPANKRMMRVSVSSDNSISPMSLTLVRSRSIRYRDGIFSRTKKSHALVRNEISPHKEPSTCLRASRARRCSEFSSFIAHSIRPSKVSVGKKVYSKVSPENSFRRFKKISSPSIDRG